MLDQPEPRIVNSKTLRQTTVFGLLVAGGIAGRFLLRDIPNFTPTVAVGVFAGFYFGGRLMAASVPLSVMVLSNLWLPAYNSPAEQLTIYAALLLPVALGRLLRRRPTPWRFGIAATLPALTFYVTSNFVVWCSTGLYPRTAAGLAECYWCAVPFFRWWLEGDLLFVPLIFAAYLIVGAAESGRLSEFFQSAWTGLASWRAARRIVR